MELKDTVKSLRVLQIEERECDVFRSSCKIFQLKANIVARSFIVNNFYTDNRDETDRMGVDYGKKNWNDEKSNILF